MIKKIQYQMKASGNTTMFALFFEEVEIHKE